MRWLLAVAVVLCAVSTVWAGPKVTEVELGTEVGANHYIAVGHSKIMDPTDTNAGTIWVMPGAKVGDINSGSPYSLPVKPAPMEGSIDGWGTILIQFSDQDLVQIQANPTIVFQNMPTNANKEILGAAQGPVNKKFISLNDAGIPTSTSVEFTIDMDSLVPHVVAIMGGAEPVVTYDPTGTGTLVVRSNTFDTSSQAGDAFSSIIGVMLVTDPTKFGATPLKLICQTDAWVGDIFPLLPGLDASAAVPGNGGTLGSLNAKSGLTIYGPTDQSRTAYLYAPDASLQALFGTTDKAQLSTYINQEKATATVNKSATNWGGEKGMSAVLTYTFASPKDVAIGGPEQAPPTTPLSVTPSALKADTTFSIDIRVGSGTTISKADLYCVVIAGNAMFTIKLDGGIKEGLSAVLKKLSIAGPVSARVPVNVAIPRSLVGQTLVFDVATVPAGTKTAQVVKKVILLGTSSAVVQP